MSRQSETKMNDIKSPFPKHQLPDPVKQHKKEEKIKHKLCIKPVKMFPTISNDLRPTLITRGAKQALEKQFVHPPPFKFPTKKKPTRPESALAQREYVYNAFQKTLPERTTATIVKLPTPSESEKTDMVFRVPSPELMTAKVKPHKPSVTSIPYPILDKEGLDLKKPKSGIIVKTNDDVRTLIDRMSIGYGRPYAIDFIKQYGQYGPIEFADVAVELGLEIGEGTNLVEVEEILNSIDVESDNLERKKKTKKHKTKETDGSSVIREEIDSELLEEAESAEQLTEEITETPYKMVSSEDEEHPEMITEWVQKFRRESDVQKYEQKFQSIPRGTLQSHSFTNIKQKLVKEYKYGIRLGSYHQGDDHFSDRSRNKQSLGMAVAAYCFAFLKHPVVWNSQNVDDILEAGDQLYCNSLDYMHLHQENVEVNTTDLLKKVSIGDLIFLYRISEPVFIGRLKSDDHRIYNLNKALTIFFNTYNCALFQTYGINLAIWKTKYLYVFDPTPRAKDLYPDPKGAASLISFYDIGTVVSMLLERTKVGNWPFKLSKIDVFKIRDPKTLDQCDSLTAQFRQANEYKILNENKAVINASFSLADPCFDFSCNKQALTMVVVALTYTIITPSAMWCRKIVDKVLLIGNELFVEIAETDDIETVELDNIPSTFTLGPYKVKLLILGNVVKGTMFSRKKYPNIENGISIFFENSNMGILQYEKFSYGLWKQRDFFYLFDPYPRDYEGYQMRDGTACFSMHNSINGLIETLMINIDKENNCPFSIHALKHLKIYIGGDELRPAAGDAGLDKKRSKKTLPFKTVYISNSTTAMVKFVPNTKPGLSSVDIASNVDSLGEEYVPKMHHEHTLASVRHRDETISKISLGLCDLDSPSLSDTQIVPPRPQPNLQAEEDIFSELSDDLFDYERLQTDAADHGEGEGDNLPLNFDLDVDDLTDFEKQMVQELNQFGGGEEEEDTYVEEGHMRTVTTMTEGFTLLEKVILEPPKLPKSIFDKMTILQKPKKKIIPEVTLSEELQKETNFENMPDGAQVLCGNINVSYFKEKTHLMTPFVTIMAVLISRKYSILSWSSDVINYIIDIGMRLYKSSDLLFDEAAIHEFERISLGSTDYSCKVSYVLDSIFKQNIMEHTLKCLFEKCASAIIVNPNYSCTIFMKNNLYYLFDPYANNKAGYGINPGQNGNACFIRFTNLHTLIARILYNKAKRESQTEYETTRYVLSIVETHLIPKEGEPLPYVQKKRTKRTVSAGKDAIKEDAELRKDDGQLPMPSTLGYKRDKDECIISGTVGLKGRNIVVDGCIKECHFVSLCAMLMLMNYPIHKWDWKRIDNCVKQGMHIFLHAENKTIFERRTVNNVLIENHFFDVVIKQLEFPLMEKKYDIKPMLDYFMVKRSFLLLQFPSCCVVYYMDKKHHLFDPYSTKKTSARWIRFHTRDKLVSYLVANVRGYYYCNYFTFDVTSIRRAPKKMALGYYVSKYELDHLKYKESLGKPFYEKEDWLYIDPIPWSRMQRKNGAGALRGEPGVMWKEWDIELPADLWSLWGNLHQKSSVFSTKTRGKQTICNCAVAILMVKTYELSEWNPILMDNILKNGDRYFQKCIMNFKSDEVEFEIEYLQPEVHSYPFVANINCEPCVEGTMFVILSHQFNLYKAISYFFNQRDSRFGILIGSNGNFKRIIAFGKVREREYFMYDCETYGPPLFLERQGCSYILRMNSMNRLVHCLTITLREGDFYIYDIVLTDIQDNSTDL